MIFACAGAQIVRKSTRCPAIYVRKFLIFPSERILKGFRRLNPLSGAHPLRKKDFFSFQIVFPAAGYAVRPRLRTDGDALSS